MRAKSTASANKYASDPVIDVSVQVSPRSPLLKTSGLCGTSALLRGEPSTSGPSFSFTKEGITVTNTERGNSGDRGGGHMTPNTHTKKQEVRVVAYRTFLPFSHTFVLLRIPAFSKFCT